MQIIFHKRATTYRSFLRKMTYKDKGSYESSPPCNTPSMPILISRSSALFLARSSIFPPPLLSSILTCHPRLPYIIFAIPPCYFSPSPLLPLSLPFLHCSELFSSALRGWVAKWVGSWMCTLNVVLYSIHTRTHTKNSVSECQIFVDVSAEFS